MTELEAAQQFLTTVLKTQPLLASLPIGFPNIPQDLQDRADQSSAARSDLPVIRCEMMTSMDQISLSRDEDSVPAHCGATELDWLVIAVAEGDNYPFDLQGAIQSALGTGSSVIGEWDIFSFRKATRTLPPSGDSGRPIREAGGAYHMIVRPA